MSLYIGIDIGTSGCRAIAIDDLGNKQGSSVTNLPPPKQKGNKIEQDANVWWTAVCDCLSELTSTINTEDVTAIAVDGTSATLLLADSNGNPLMPAIMYNDSRATIQAEKIAEVAPSTTAAHGSSCTLAKLLWLFQTESTQKSSQQKNITANTRFVLHQADWITGKLCGQFGISDYNNSLKLGYETQNETWPDWVLKLLEDAKVSQEILPKVIAPGVQIGTLTPELAAQFKLPASTQIISGTTDSTASFIATGANKTGEAVTALGSTLVLKVICEEPVFAADYGIYSQPLIIGEKVHWLVGGASNSGGSVLKQFFSNEQLQKMTPQLDPEKPTGLDYYPLPFTGERFPANNAQLKPKLEPRPESDLIFFQGLLEGIADIEAKGYRLLADLGAHYPASIYTTGGGAKNAAWTKIRATALNCEMRQAIETEAAYGTALLAKRAVKSTQIIH